MDKSIIPDIKSKIYTIRGLQVMLDSDLAELYDVETGNLNKAAKRNINRFPENFMFQLSEEELKILRFQFGISSDVSLKLQNITSNEYSMTLRSQNATLETSDFRSQSNVRCQNETSSSEILKSQIATSSWGGKRKLPYVFTEQGVSMLSGVLKSKTAIRISIQIMNAFVSMRKFISANASIFQRVGKVERRLLEHDKKFEQVFDAIESKNILPDKGIFFEGQIFDAYKFVSDIIRSATNSIILIDNYIDDSILTLFSKRKKEVKVTIFTKDISKQLTLDLQKYNSQYPPIEIIEFKQSHDRFIIIDNMKVYHFGASLKDLGKKWFAFSRLDKESVKILDKIKEHK
jgi:hypothetical protein